MITNERVPNCPVCHQGSRTLIHHDLADVTFRAAVGSWSLWRCSNCEAAYLDPRPDRATIMETYKKYYTHTQEEPSSAPWSSRLKTRLLNGHLYWRHGTRRHPCSVLGGALLLIFPPIRQVFEVHERHLPKGGGAGRSLLDVGCGDGSFVSLARELGWDAQGLEPDSTAAAESMRKGAKVLHGSIEIYDGQSELFDVITMNHVIEHVHDPVSTLRDCHRLLKPRGILWISTPNIDSLGHARFRRHWRGLEAPRHLVLFNEKSMVNALKTAGFESARRLNSGPSIVGFMAKDSHSISMGQLPDAHHEPMPLRLRFGVWARDGVQHYLRPDRREFLFLAAHKNDLDQEQ